MNYSELTEVKPYPAYKTSQIPWIGEIPEHWEVSHLRYFCECLDGRRIPLSAENRGDKQGNIPYWGANSVIDHINGWIFDEPLVLVGEDGAPFTDTTRSVAFFVNKKVWVNNHIHVLRCSKELRPEFLVHILNSVDYKDFISGSTRDKLTQQRLLDIPIQLAPPTEQAAIVRYLDEADQQIQAYIVGKERLIALLEEERQALVHQAVTRGLDPNVRLKPSRMEWLGDVPEHWEVRRLKLISVIQTGITIGPTYDEDGLIERPYLRVANVQSDHLDLSKVTTIRVSPAEIKRATLRVGDVLMTEGGDIDKLGRGCVWLGEIPDCLHQNHVFAVRPDPRCLNPEFLVALMGSFHTRTYFYVTAKQTTNLAATNRTTLGNLPMCLPCPDEQLSILEFITAQFRAQDDAIERTRRQIDLMNEYRTRLIADVVTGKIDVREVAERLPELKYEDRTAEQQTLSLTQRST